MAGPAHCRPFHFVTSAGPALTAMHAGDEPIQMTPPSTSPDQAAAAGPSASDKRLHVVNLTRRTVLATSLEVADTGPETQQGAAGPQGSCRGRRALDLPLRVSAHLLHAVPHRPGLPRPQEPDQETSSERAPVAAFSLPLRALDSRARPQAPSARPRPRPATWSSSPPQAINREDFKELVEKTEPKCFVTVVYRLRRPKAE